MKALLSILVLSACLTACDSAPKKPKPVPPPGTGDISGLSWNRPQKWQGQAGLGGMMPQSR
jgi:hypothetical protein